MGEGGSAEVQLAMASTRRGGLSSKGLALERPGETRGACRIPDAATEEEIAGLARATAPRPTAMTANRNLGTAAVAGETLLVPAPTRAALLHLRGQEDTTHRSKATRRRTADTAGLLRRTRTHLRRQLSLAMVAMAERNLRRPTAGTVLHRILVHLHHQVTLLLADRASTRRTATRLPHHTEGTEELRRRMAGQELQQDAAISLRKLRRHRPMADTAGTDRLSLLQDRLAAIGRLRPQEVLLPTTTTGQPSSLLIFRVRNSRRAEDGLPHHRPLQRDSISDGAGDSPR